MMKNVLIFISLVPILLVGVTRTVSLGGSHQYTSIQTAINASANNDTILVYPGRYIENINLNHHNVTITSLYSLNPQQVYIDSTIIDGNLNTCIKAENGETFTINGITITNNEQNVTLQYAYWGGALRIWNNNHVTLTNCVIRNCIGSYGGAIYLRKNSVLNISNTIIKNNLSLDFAGGLYYGENCQINWDTQQLSQLYDNVAPMGMDFYLFRNTQPANILLLQGSTLLTEADDYYIVYSSNSAPPVVSINQGYFTPIDNDIYVSPTGADDNDGLTATTPFRTIKHALQLIASNPDNPRTIHLAEGVYSQSANGQVLPLALKPYVKLIGSGSENTIIDGELQTSFFGAYGADGAWITDIKFMNCRSSSLVSNFTVYISNNLILRNLIFENNSDLLSTGINLVACNNTIIENIVITGTSVANGIMTISTYSCFNIYMNNIVSSNNHVLGSDYNDVGFYLTESDVTIRNAIIANNTAQDACLLYYQNINAESSENNLDMSNVLITNNSIPNCSWVFAPVYLQNRYHPIKVSNCTFANNTSNTSFSKIFAYADVNNLISYNPQCPSELYLRNNIASENIQAEVNISNSLFRTNTVNSDLPNLVRFNNNIFDGNPLFLGSVTDTLVTSQPEYYYLSSGSPCINTGTADTTGLNLPLVDLAGNYRVWDNRIDMGCFEYGSEHVGSDNPEYPPLPDRITLSLYPNPVYLNGSKGAFSFIEFTLPEKAKERPVVEVYNLKGQRVRTMQVGESFTSLARKAELTHYVVPAKAGIQPVLKKIKSGDSCLRRNDTGEFYSTVFDCRDDNSQRLASGIYIVKVTSGKHQKAMKMTILK